MNTNRNLNNRILRKILKGIRKIKEKSKNIPLGNKKLVWV